MSRFVRLSIANVIDETPEAYTLVFSPTEIPEFSYLAGQYLTIRIVIDGVEHRRSYSLSSSPMLDAQMAITIKRVQGGLVSNFLRDQIGPGDELEVMPPMGHFTIEPDPSVALRYVLIGGGSGISPLMSILRTVLNSEPKSCVSLWFCNRRRESIIFKEQLAELSERYPQRLHVFHTLTQPEEDWAGARGRLDAQMVYHLTSELFMTDELRKRYYLCGPEGLMNGAEEALDKHAVHPADIHRELFSSAVPTDEEVEMKYSAEGSDNKDLVEEQVRPELISRVATVHLDGGTSQISVSAGEPVLDAAMDAGLDPPYSCRGGNCSACMALLLRGEIWMDRKHGLSPEELDQGYVLTCQSYPLTDDVELDYDQ